MPVLNQMWITLHDVDWGMFYYGVKIENALCSTLFTFMDQNAEA